MPLDNLFHIQNKTAQDILNSYSSGLLPQSLLFYGPKNSGRLTGAMDLSFFLTGDEDKRDILRSNSIIYLPSREMSGRIRTALELFKTQRTRSARLFLIESIRLALMQYHPALSASATSTSSSYFSLSGEIDEVLLNLEDDRDYSDKEINEIVKSLDRCLDPRFLYCGKKSPSTVTIDQIRAVQEYFSQLGEEKVVVFENVEDATDGAKNSLLKMLEEPEEKSHMILLSSNPQKLLETILSRVRKFQFPPLGEKKTASLIKEKFGVWEEYPSFDSFFCEKGSGEEARKEFDRDLNAVSEALISSKPLVGENEEEILSSLEKLSAWSHFVESLLYLLEKAWKEGRINSINAKRKAEILNSFTISTDVYNMGPRMAFDLLLREAISVK